MPTTMTWPLESGGDVDVVSGPGALSQAESTTLPPMRSRGTSPRTGLRVPMGVNAQGRTALTSGENQDRKIIRLALSDNDNNNAFQQDPGLGADMVFDINDPVTRGVILRRLRLVFQEFERQKRYRLQDETIKWTEAEGELILDFEYLNLESDRPDSFTQRYGQDL